MELMPGHKHSDVGVIPDDWDAKPLGEIGDSLIGLTYRPSEVRAYGTLVLRSSNVQNGALCFDDNVFVDTDTRHDKIASGCTRSDWTRRNGEMCARMALRGCKCCRFVGSHSDSR